MSFYQQAGRYIKECDFFGTPISLNLDKKSRYKSYLGALVSLLSSTIIITFCWNIFISYLNQENLYVNSDTEYNQDPSLIELNQDNFFFAINLKQMSSVEFASIPYFGVKVEQAYYGGFGSSRIKQFSTIPMQKCLPQNIQRISKQASDAINVLGISNLICPSTEFSIKLQGQYMSEIFQFLKITIIPCDENDKSWNFDRCATDSERSKFLAKDQQYRVNIFHTNYAINLNHIGSEYQQQYLTEELTFSFLPEKIFKQNDIFFKPVVVKRDDSAIILSSYEYSNFIIQDYRELKEYFNIDQSGSEYQISYFRRSPETIVMRREYQKFSAVMVQFGGLIKFVITVAGFFVTKYNSFLFTVEIANKLYNFNFGNSSTNKNQSEGGAESKKGRSSILKSASEISPTKIKEKANNIQMVTLKQEPVQESLQTENINSTNGNTILNTLCKKRNSKKNASPRVTPRSLKDIQEESCSPQFLNSNPQSKIQKNGSLEKIEEELSKQNIEIKVQEEVVSKPIKIEPPIQNIAQKFQPHRKDSVRQLQLFQENIQNQYYKNIKIKKQSLVNNLSQNYDDKINFENSPPILNGKLKGFLRKESAPIKPLILPQTNNIIQNLVYFKEIGFKNKKDFLIEQFRVIINRSKKLTVKVWYFMRLLTCGKCFNTEENFLIEKARQYAQKDLDIFIILDKLQEIEKIKKILLNENQLTLFNFSQKPLIQKDDNFFNTLSLRNLQIKHRKSETIASKNKVNNSSHNLLGLQKTLFCQKLQYDNIEAYEKLHRAYENIAPFHIQDKVSRSLVKELGTELREIFELSKLIDVQTESNNTPISTPLRNASKPRLDSRNFDDLELDQMKHQQQKSRNSIHICDGVYGSLSKQPSKSNYGNECFSPEEKPIDEHMTYLQQNPYSFTTSTTNKPARLSIFKNLKGVHIHDLNNAIQENSNSSLGSSSSSSDDDSNSSTKSKSKSKSQNSDKQQLPNRKKAKTSSNEQDYQNSNQSKSQQNSLGDNDCTSTVPNIHDDNKGQASPQFQTKSIEFDISKSFNLPQISLNQTLQMQEIDLDYLNNTICKMITETNIKESQYQQKEFHSSPTNPEN